MRLRRPEFSNGTCFNLEERICPVRLYHRLRSKLVSRRSAWLRMAGIPAIPLRSHLPTLLTANGETGLSSSPAAEPLRHFSPVSGRGSLITRLIKELWAFTDNRIAVRFAYEFRDDNGQWFRAYGNENWEFEANGVMRRRIASINEHPIAEADRKFRWPLGRRPDNHPGLSDFRF